MRKALTLTVLIYAICMSIYHVWGIGKTTDEDYIIEMPKLEPTKPDTSDFPPIKPRDTKPYKGKWVDVN